MKSKRVGITLILGICTLLVNAQNLWQAMPNSSDFVDMRYIFQDSVTGILYVGLPKKVVGGDTVNCITFWNGTQWDNLGDGASSHGENVSSILRYQDTIYAAGAFDAIYGCPATSIMKWDGIDWLPVGYGNCEGTNCCGSVLSLFENNGQLYVVGRYDTIGCKLSNGIATWNGSVWSPAFDFPNNLGQCCQNLVSAAFYNNQLYVSGAFESVDSGGKNIAYYNGTIWKTPGGGISGTLAFIFDMVVYKNELYIGGRFTTADGNITNYIARWDGYEWHDVGGGTDGQIFDLLIYHDKLYVFGGFSRAGDVPANRMACWDGNRWCGIETNMISGAPTIAAIYNDTILVGGGVHIAQGNDTILYFAKFLGGDYVDTCGAAVGISEIDEINFSISPNPATSKVEINLPFNNQSQQLKITNTLGQLIKLQQFSSNKISIDISDLSAGVYFLELQNEKGRVVKKFVKE